MMNEYEKEARFLTLIKSLHLPSNLLAESQQNFYNNRKTPNSKHLEPYQQKPNNSRQQRVTIDVFSGPLPLKRPLKIDQKSMMKQTLDATSYSNNTNSGRKKWIVEKELERPVSLYRRLNNMRTGNDDLESFSISKLISKIKLVKEKPTDPLLLEERIQVARKPANRKKLVKPKLYSFDPSTKKKGSVSPTLRTNAEQESSQKIFKRYYCPPTSYREREPVATPADPRQGLNSQHRRIHNFYSSQMYRKGYDRYFRKSIDVDQS